MITFQKQAFPVGSWAVLRNGGMVGCIRQVAGPSHKIVYGVQKDGVNLLITESMKEARAFSDHTWG